MWRLEDGGADLDLAWLAGKVNLRQPQAGLTSIRIDGKPIITASILQMRTRSADSDECWRLTDGYVRGDDLVALYAQTEHGHYSPQIYWRAMCHGTVQAVGVELIASVQTSLLESDASSVFGSTLPATEVWWMADREGSRFEPVTLSDTESFAVESGVGTGLFLFRLANGARSYVEMIHAADFTVAEVTQRVTPDGGIRSAFRLFGEPLEKGVIRRARLRGVFVPRDGDRQAAIQCYRCFAQSAVPLTA